MCDTPTLSKTRDRDVTPSTVEKQLDKPEKPLNPTVEKSSNGHTNTVDPREPPQKTIGKPSFMISYNQWRQNIYAREHQMCTDCRRQLPEVLKLSKLARVCQSQDDAVKIEVGEGIVKGIRQNCIDGLCKEPKSGEKRGPGRGHKAKPGRTDVNEDHLDLQVVDGLKSFVDPFGDTGNRFLVPIDAWQHVKLLKRAAELARSAVNLKIPDPPAMTYKENPQDPCPTRPRELLGAENPRLSAFSDDGRLERVKALEIEVRHFAQTASKSGIPVDQPQVIRFIGLKVEAMAYKHSVSVLAYLNKIEKAMELLHSEKTMIRCRFENDRTRLSYDPDLFKMLKEGDALVIKIE